MNPRIEKLRTMMEQGIKPPVAELMGSDLVEVDEGEAVIELEAGKRHHSPPGNVHGGVLSSIADSAMGVAFQTTLGEGESFTSLDLNIKFLQPVTEDTIRAEAEVVKRGGTTGLVECDVRDSGGELVARAESTLLVLDADRVSGSG